MTGLINREAAVFDTSVLLDLLMINYLNVNKNPALNKKWESLLFGKNSTFKLNYNYFANKFTGIITTSQAIGELQGLVNSRIRFQNRIEDSFWENSIIFLREKKLDEQLVKLVSTFNKKPELVNKFGYVDTGLIELAQKVNLPIITNDRKTLAGACLKNMVEVFIPVDWLSSKIIQP
jgi:predicted nucleic acid-binding protein